MSKTETQIDALTPQLRLRFAATQHLALCEKFGAEGFKLDLPQDAVQEIISLLDRAERLDAENKALRAQLESPAAQAGWKLVPAKPTDAMLGAAQKAWLADPLRRSSTLYAAALAAAPQAPVMDATAERDEAFEAVRQRLCKLPKYSFILADGDGGAVGVARRKDGSGRWIEFQAAHELLDPVAVDAAIAAQAAVKTGDAA
ncbi:hypothetical protein [Delftia tsuruhatensis]|uniref:hypothetical protein n=1 Tax=Delftia tsuruhatensis TaxID=180282 RepID=UPI002444F9D7|nr:hypothetical protein [Delftia tsuruhatensis]MDH1461849.1 hypothetical protein [Delftia tsuruhatensis]WGG09972.1 hypothetical protein N5O86_25510 [Delftia tsuruhatensis]